MMHSLYTCSGKQDGKLQSPVSSYLELEELSARILSTYYNNLVSRARPRMHAC